VSIVSFAYSGFLISALQTGDAIVSIVPIDNIFLSVIMIFFVTAHYRYKEMNWFSSEGRNLELFRRLKHKPISLYKSKLKLNSIILLPMILIYAVSPLLFIMTYNYTGILYSLIRVVLIMTYAIILLEYPLINGSWRFSYVYFLYTRHRFFGFSNIYFSKLFAFTVFIYLLACNRRIIYCADFD